ncbi:MAG: SPOR domain-containing protein [Burkholderiales bacterium]
MWRARFFKHLFIALALANVVFFLTMQTRNRHDVEPPAAHKPINADRIQIVELGSDPPLDAVDLSEHICIEWGSFDRALAMRASEELETQNPGIAVSVQNAVDSAGHWVYYPALPSEQAAREKFDELKTLGVADMYLMQGDAKWKNAISLGVFRTQQAAENYLAQLRAKGVKSATITQREISGDQVSVVVKHPDVDATTALVKLKLGYPGTDIRAVECPRKVLEQP